jgi:hypothetical protein
MGRSILILAIIMWGLVARFSLDCDNSSDCPGKNRCVYVNNTYRGTCVPECGKNRPCTVQFTECVELVTFKNRRKYSVCALQDIIDHQEDHLALAKSWVA